MSILFLVSILELANLISRSLVDFFLSHCLFIGVLRHIVLGV